MIKQLIRKIMIIAGALVFGIVLIIVAGRIFLHPLSVRFLFERDDAAISCLNNGNDYLKAEEYDLAIEAFNDALVFRPNWSIALENIETVRRREVTEKELGEWMRESLEESAQKRKNSISPKQH